MKRSTLHPPTRLEWCSSCERYISGSITGHLDHHVGRDVFEARRSITEIRRRAAA